MLVHTTVLDYAEDILFPWHAVGGLGRMRDPFCGRCGRWLRSVGEESHFQAISLLLVGTTCVSETM